MQDYQDGFGWQATDAQTLLDRLQYNVKTGCSVSPGTNNMTVQVASGEIVHNGSTVSVSAQDNLSLASADGSNPRKDIIYLDGTGTLQKATGSASAAEPSGQTHRQTYNPSPPDLSATDATVLAEVWVGAGVNDIASGDVSDRRMFADAVLDTVTADSVEAADSLVDAAGVTHSGELADASDVSGTGGTPDTIVTSTSELESAFTNLSSGDYVYIKTPNTPYRTNQWLDIDVSNVRIEGESPFANDGQALVKPADAADVGGVRVGHTTAASNVTISGIGFDGNQATMTDTVKRLHAFDLEAGDNITVRNCYATQTHPYHEHSSGGSGISVTDNVSNAVIQGNHIVDIGDRGIQCAGVDCKVINNTAADGFDRSFAHAVQKDDGSVAGGFRIITAFNIGWNNSNGSIIGIGGGGSNTPRGRIVVYGNIGYGNTRDGFTAFNGATGSTYKHIQIRNNYFYNTGQRGIEVREGPGDPVEHVTIQNNTIESSGGTGIYANAEKVLISGNVVDTPGADYGIRLGNESTPKTDYITAVNNSIYQSPSAAIRWDTGEGRVAGNLIVGPVGHGITASVDDAIFEGNQIRNAGNDGIMQTGNDCIILGNRIKGSTNAGIDDTGTGTVVQANITGDPN